MLQRTSGVSTAIRLPCHRGLKPDDKVHLMETVKTFLIEIVCPDCGRKGTAHASSREQADIGMAVSLDQIPYGFSLAQEATAKSGPQVQCQCGAKFEPVHD